MRPVFLKGFRPSSLSEAHTPFGAEGVCSEKGSHPILNILIQEQVIAKEKYHHEEHDGHKVKSGYKKLRDLRVLHGSAVVVKPGGGEILRKYPFRFRICG